MEFFLKDIGVPNVQPNRYANSQFEAYCRVWQSLQALRLAGDDLWEKANKANIETFSVQSRHTLQVVWESDLFLEENDRKALTLLLKAMAKFRLGKLRLSEIREEEDIERFFTGYSTYPDQDKDKLRYKTYRRMASNKVHEQVLKNKRYMDHYERILENVRTSFRKKLSRY